MYTISHVPTTQPDQCPIQVKLVNDDHEQVLSTPDFINDEAHQLHSYPDLLVNWGTAGLHGDPDIFNKALKYVNVGPMTQATY